MLQCKLSHFQRHSASAVHGCNIRGEPIAPSATEFESVLRDVCRGIAAGKDGAGKGGRKFRQMVLCLADAAKELQQDFVKSSTSLVLMRDARAGKVALRFAAIDAKMRVTCGLVGWMALTSSTGMSIRDITDECFKRFGTLRVESPAAQKLKNVRRDLKLKVHTIVTDAAANEVMASEIALGDQQPGGQALTPHATLIVRDRAHGLRRLASRPFSSITALKRCAAMMFRSRGAPAQLIHHSPELRREFKAFLLDRCASSTITNMRAAKHRFESWAKPAGRACILVRPYMLFTVRLLSKRREVCARAQAFLQYCSLEHWLLCGMLAEAWDELMAVVRAFDREEVPVERLASRLASFFSRIVFLFGRERGCLRPGSYVHHVWTELKRSPVSWFDGREARELGGRDPTATELNHCFALMEMWVQLALAEARSEFPQWDVAMAVRVFDVVDGSAPATRGRHGEFVDKDVLQHLQRLAQLAGQCPVDVVEQYREALRALERSGYYGLTDNVGAWRAYLKCRAREGALSAAALRACLLRWQGLRFSSTSGIEQNFTKVMHRISNRQMAASPRYEEALVRLIMDAGSLALGDLVGRAQRSWQKHKFGIPRASGTKRADRRGDAGKTKCSVGPSDHEPPTTEAAFLKRRRAFSAEPMSVPRASKF